MSRTVALRLKAAAAAGGVVLLLMIVAVAAGSLPGADPTGPFVDIDVERIGSVMRRVLFVLYLALLANALYWLLGPRDRRASRRSSKRASPLVTALSVLLVAVTAFLIRGSFQLPTPPTETVGPGPHMVGQVVGSSGPDATSVPTAPGWELVVLALAGLAAVTYLVITRRRLQPVESLQGAPPPSLPASREGPSASAGDPRSRVFAAYRSVENAAVSLGIERRPSDTVGRHLRRLADVVTDAPGRLALVYNRARFSPHSISAVDADEAELAATEITDGLA